MKYVFRPFLNFLFLIVGLGNMWTYNTHNAVEAIRVSCDTDVLLGGVGLYGGRGHYHAKIKVTECVLVL